MKKYGVWLKTEYKRAAVLLPSIFIKAVIALVITGMVVFCMVKIFNNEDKAPVQIAYEETHNQMSQFALSYVENMSSVKSFYTLVPMNKKNGMEALRQGEIQAFLVLPENVVDGILSGENQPAQLYLSSRQALGGLLFEELAGAGVGLLQTAQAQIYATHKLVMDFSLDHANLEEMYEQINTFNLAIAMNREQFFHKRTLSVTENESMMVYYAGAFLSIYLLFLGILWGKHIKRDLQEMRIFAHRLGISVWKQITLRIGITGLMLSVSFIPILAFLLFPGIRQEVNIVFFPGMILFLVLSFLFTATWIQLVSLIAHQKHAITWILVLSTMAWGYLSGYFIPTSLLPDVIKKIAIYLPTTYLRQIFSGLFSGMIEDYGRAVFVLLSFIVVMVALCILLSGRKSFSLTRNTFGNTQSMSKKKMPPIILILLKRQFYKKSLLACLLVSSLLSVMIVKLEQKSETTVIAGVYAEDEHLIKLLEDRNGLVKFTFYKSIEELKENVVKGKVECGYVLQEELQNDIVNGNGNWSITVYQKADSTLTLLINEVLFERIFYNITSEWYEGYIANSKYFETIKAEIGVDQLKTKAKEALWEKQNDGSTFSVMVKAPDGYVTQEERNVASYPLWLVLICNLFFSALIGVRENYVDRHMGRFPQRPPFFMACCTIILPISIALAVNVVMIVLLK